MGISQYDPAAAGRPAWNRTTTLVANALSECPGGVRLSAEVRYAAAVSEVERIKVCLAEARWMRHAETTATRDWLSRASM